MTTTFEEILVDIRDQLDDTVKYWLAHSLDDRCGGYFNSLTKSGQVYDTVKYGWLQGRQVWTLCRLYNDVNRFKTSDILAAAKHGAPPVDRPELVARLIFRTIVKPGNGLKIGVSDIILHLRMHYTAARAMFLEQHIKSETEDRCYFSVSQDGIPIKTQRTIFTESFYTIALSEMYRATSDKSYLEKAVIMMDKIIYWAFTDATDIGLGPVGVMSAHPLNVPLIVLGTLEQIYLADPSLSETYIATSRKAAAKVLQHVIEVDGHTFVFENVGADGEKLDGSSGNLLNPGHAIEAGWFLLEYLKSDPDSDIDINYVIENFILRPMSYGWDNEFGGLYYFLDARGADIPPSQLEWHMKLWWPHNEAMIALLMAYEATMESRISDLFVKVYKYSKAHFVDREYGEWYGYLDRQGEPTSTAKGAPFKGCFHVPRCLLMCEEILTRILAKE